MRIKSRKPEKIRIHGFTTKLNECCSDDELRPPLSRIHFHNGFAYASDAHVLVKIPLSRYDIHETVSEQLNGYSIHKTSFKMIYNKNITIMPGEIIIPDLFSIRLKPVDEKEASLIRQMDELIPTKDKFQPVDQIAINPNLIMKAYKALGCKYATKIRFVAANRGMLLECNEMDAPGIAVIMPVMINEK